MALTQQQIIAAQQWLNQNYGMSSPSGQGWDFEKAGFSMPNDTGLGASILGAAQGMGYGDADLSQILGYTPEQIGSYRTDNFQDQYNNDGYRNNAVDRASLVFATDNGWSTPDMYRDNLMDNGGRFGWTGGADGGYNESMRDVFGNVRYQDTGGLPAAGGGGNGDNGNGGRKSGGNPYLQELAGQMGQNWTDVLNEQWLPQIRDNSIAAGGLGGSRAGVAQGLAIGKAGQGYASELAKLYGGAWESSQNRDLSRYGIDTNADLTNQGQWMNYDLGNQGLGLQGMRLGADLMGMGSQGEWGGFNNFGNFLNGAGSNNYTGSQSSNQGGGWGGALGGGLLGYGLWNQYNRAGG